jgi:histidinol phosphatase-like enzyme
MKRKTYVFDLDGVLATEEKTFEKSLAKPIQNNIDILNQLYDCGHTIIIHTARGWAEFKMTDNWLNANNIHRHSLVMGKPIADVYVDDKALNVNDIDKLKGE